MLVDRANSNTVNLVYWMMTYLLFDQPLFTSIRKETEGAFQNGSIDVKYLLQQCPVLESVYYEVLRLVNGAMSSRKVMAPTPIGGKILQPGNIVMFPFRQLHLDERVWGEDAPSFNPHRFLNNKALVNHRSFRPFGGGASACPGRYLTKTEALSFIALLLHRFDVKLSTFPERGLGGNQQPFPKIDVSKPSTGIRSPVDFMDVFVEVSPSTR